MMQNMMSSVNINESKNCKYKHQTEIPTVFATVNVDLTIERVCQPSMYYEPYVYNFGLLCSQLFVGSPLFVGTHCCGNQRGPKTPLARMH
jgi:hypothetical protein